MRSPLDQQPQSIPPYVPYRTFRNFLEWLKDGIPARIDRSFWGQRLSGGSGTQLMTALRVLELIDAQQRPSEALEQLVRAEGEERRQLLRRMLERHYAPILVLDLARATKSQFHEAFQTFGTKEGVLAKCEAFFIQAAQEARIELSAFILSRRHGTRRTGAVGRPRSQPSDRAAPHQALVGASQRPLAELILAKYPDFDPAWSPEVQARWLDGIARLYEGLRDNADAQQAPKAGEPAPAGRPAGQPESR